MRRYHVEARRQYKGRVLWMESTYKHAERPKAAALAAGMSRAAHANGRVDMGGRYDEPPATDGAFTRWIVTPSR